MTEENRSSLNLGHDGQSLSSETTQGNSDTTNPVFPTPQHSGAESPNSESPPRPDPDPPSGSSSSSSSPSVVSDDRTELQKFIQSIKDDAEHADRLKAILNGLEKHQIRQRYSNANDKNAMHMAIDRGMLWVVRQLLDYTHNDTLLLCEPDANERQPLHRACLGGHRDIADLLLQRGADIEAGGPDGATPLDDACWQGHKDVVELLLSRGANSQALENDGWSPVRSATGHEKLDVVEILLNENPANINVGDKYGETPLHVASGKGYVDIMRLLLEKGAEIDKPDKDGETPLHSASRNGWGESVRLLLKEQAKIDKTDDKGETPLHAASRKGHKEVVGVLIEGKASINATDDTGKTPLYAASQEGHEECINRLCEAGADCNVPSAGMKRALHYAFEPSTKNESPEERKKTVSGVVARLLKYGADPALQNDEGETALHLAARTGNGDAITGILGVMKDGQNRLKTKEGDTALGLSLKSDPAVILGLMTDLDSARLFDAEDEEEALLWAAERQENHHYAEELFEARKYLRGKMPPRDSNGWSAIQWATYLELPEVLDMLRNAPPAIRSEEEKAEEKAEEKPERPTAGAEQEEFLKNWGPKAAVVEYSEQDDGPLLLTKFRIVQDVIYGAGPTAGATTKEAKGSDALFTWVHLPATNITWMSDLLKTILIEDPSCLDGSQEFFDSSWSQIPDTTSESRIMKPLYTTETIPQAKAKAGSGTPLHAIYIPYLALSRQHRGQYHTKNEGKQPQNEREKGEKGGNQEESQLQGAHDAYHGLLKCYEGNVIHGSAALGESFCGFPNSQQKLAQQRALHSVQEHAAQHDRQVRNGNQVLTKTLHPGGVAESSCGTLVRVNQLWAWVIADKWLITATTHPIDQTEDPFLRDTLDYVEKRAGGVSSPLEMARGIVEYCIDSYDRQPKSTVYGTNHSIRQIFSDAINKIAREDAKLVEDFYEHMGAKQPKGNDKLDVEDRREMGREEASEKDDKVNTNQPIEEAVKAAVRLSAEIRNIGDELQMLRAIAQHQKRVQKKLKKRSSAHKGRWETNVMSDIEDMIASANRIKSNVEMTLSLGQREIANYQAKESVRQGKIANEQAVLANQHARESFRQGRMAVIFSAATAFLLTSSSLSSLSAMDVDSFHKVPYWAVVLVFLISAALLYILWLRQINRDADVEERSKERFKTMRFVESEKEDWHIVRNGLVTWRRRQRESPSEV